MAGGLLGFALAGAAEGYGTSIKEKAVAKREAALEAIRNGWLREREADSRSFQREERLASQDFQREMATIKAGTASEEFGLNPQYGVDADGNSVLLQLGKSGTAHQTQLPDGVRLSREPIKLDAGTHFILLDPITRQPVGQIEKENFQESFDKAAGSESGKARGAARSSIATAQQAAAQVEQQVSELKNDPYLDRMLGPIDSNLPNISANAARVQSKIDQLQGGAFLQARQLLKGGGQITDYEGQRAEKAFVRLNQAQNSADFKAALDDFNYWVQEGLRKLQAEASGADYEPAAPDVDSGPSFKPLGTGETRNLGGGITIKRTGN